MKFKCKTVQLIQRRFYPTKGIAPIRVTIPKICLQFLIHGEQCSLHLLGGLSNSRSDQLGIDRLNLGDLLDDLWDGFILGIEVVVDGVSNEENRFDILQRLQFCEFIPRFDLVVADQKSMKGDTRLQVKLLNVVVRDPKLLEGLANVFQTLESPDLVAAK